MNLQLTKLAVCGQQETEYLFRFMGGSYIPGFEGPSTPTAQIAGASSANGI